MTEDIKEHLDEVESKQKIDLPEAPVSITIRAFYKSYSMLITRRGDKGDMSKLIKDAATAIDWMDNQEDYDASWDTKAKPKERKVVEGKECPKCGSEVVEGVKKDGSIFHKCSTQKYIDGNASGCDWVDWLNK